jgi:hypothetical protein
MAEKETDPALREKLWEEYLAYKTGKRRSERPAEGAAQEGESAARGEAEKGGETGGQEGQTEKSEAKEKSEPSEKSEKTDETEKEESGDGNTEDPS